MHRKELWDFMQIHEGKQVKRFKRLYFLLGALALTVLAFHWDVVRHRKVDPDFKSVVRITATVTEGESIGSGVIIAPRKILTAAHVIGNAETVTVELWGEHGVEIYDAKVERKDTFKDLALLVVDKSLKHQTILSLDEPNVGDELLVVGSSCGLSPFNISPGRLTAKYAPEKNTKWQSSAPVYYGDSGGGVFDHRTGFLIGIMISAGYARGEIVYNISFFRPAYQIQAFLEECTAPVPSSPSATPPGTPDTKDTKDRF